MSKKTYDFSGWVTKYNIKCSDGRTIKHGAFNDDDGKTVPLVWQHQHNSPTNILGHVTLEVRKEGVYGYGKFNKSEFAETAKELVVHSDIESLSIFANQLAQQGGDVLHGVIREVSLVLSGANPGAFIDTVLAHGSTDTVEGTMGGFSKLDRSTEFEIVDEISHACNSNDTEYNEDKDDADESNKGNQNGGNKQPSNTKTNTDDATIADIVNSMTEEQQNVLWYLIAQAIENEEDADDSKNKGGNETMKHSVFEGRNNKQGKSLSHSEFATIMQDAQRLGSLKESVLAHATDYGIESVESLFPDAQTVGELQWVERDTEWVAAVLNGIGRTPFSRIRSALADMDIETARAKGYVKKAEKKEVYLKAAKRVTIPTTVYVKQKIDRDDMIDVTDFNVVDILRRQQRVLLNEEIARAVLIGDGRESDDNNKINEECIRPIVSADVLYSIKETLKSQKDDIKGAVKEMSLSAKRYKGSGSPVLFTTADFHGQMLWIEDTNGRRIYESDEALCAILHVSKIVEVPAMEGLTREDSDGSKHQVVAIKVNLADYKLGADKGGEISSFEDFDIDFNQMKYLMETRCSGALVKAKSAQVYEYAANI